LVPEYTQQVIAAAKSAGATVIVPGNVYNFGATPGTWDENTPQNPNTRKGRIRVAMERAYRDSGVRTVILRAGSFITPDGKTDVMGLVFLRSINKGQLVTPGNADAMQAFCYVPDWARAAVALAEMRADLQDFEDIPFPGHAFSALDLQRQLQNTLQRKIKLAGFPWLVMTIAAPFWELARELKEMRYLWSTSLEHIPSTERHEIRPSAARFSGHRPENRDDHWTTNRYQPRPARAGLIHAPVWRPWAQVHQLSRAMQRPHPEPPVRATAERNRPADCLAPSHQASPQYQVPDRRAAPY